MSVIYPLPTYSKAQISLALDPVFSEIWSVCTPICFTDMIGLLFLENFISYSLSLLNKLQKLKNIGIANVFNVRFVVNRKEINGILLQNKMCNNSGTS